MRIYDVRLLLVYVFFFNCSGDHRDLHVLTHSFPTRRSSDLFPTYRKVREAGPVFIDPVTGWYFVTDYELVRKLTEIGRAHVCTPVTNANLVCRLLPEKKNNEKKFKQILTKNAKIEHILRPGKVIIDNDIAAKHVTTNI